MFLRVNIIFDTFKTNKKHATVHKCELRVLFFSQSAYARLFNAACAAASLAIGTRKGEQDT